MLFIYANVGVDGSIGLGAGVTIRHLAENAGVVIAVLASDNPAENIVTASRLPRPKKANLIWTLDRKGVAFGGFFQGAVYANVFRTLHADGLGCHFAATQWRHAR